MAERIVGAVLCGGESRRMGEPKALIEVGGRTMAGRAVDALRGCGASEVVLVGGDPRWAEDLDVGHVPDRWPGEGPLGGLATAVLDGPGEAVAREDVVVVVACDQPWLDAGCLAALVSALDERPQAGAAAPRTPDERVHPFPSAWRARTGKRLGTLMVSSSRRADAGFGLVTLVEVPMDGAPLADVDEPSDLP